MWKQLAGFAAFGAVVAALGAALSLGGQDSSGGPDIWMAWGPGSAERMPPEPDDLIITAAVGGAVVGVLVAGVLWAVGVRLQERDGIHLGRVVAAGLIGVVVGVAPAAILLADAFAGDSGDGYPVLVVYAVSGVFGYLLVLAGISGILRITGDPHTRATVVATAVALPVGAVLATVTGLGVGAWFDHTNTVPAWVATILLVVMILGATFGFARAWAMRRRAEPVAL
ncbi:hypothetical protein [Gordonia sp. 'Campus']|uniref:hypothetical protein n=1 Tax=Gordonia sp. 'Campus' TaxID=2915824 RepID=UPI001EE439D3|nr:hypothetical protein [Gordonia sp. 'Campus']